MDNRVITAFFESADAKLLPKNQPRIEVSGFYKSVDYDLDNKERYARGNQALRETAIALEILNGFEAAFSDPDRSSRAAKLQAFNEMAEILNAALDANTDTDMIARAMNLEAIRKRINGQPEAARLEAIG